MGEGRKPPYLIDPARLKRFDARRNIFGRILNDEKAPFYSSSMFENVPSIIERHIPGYSRVEFARLLAGWTLYNYFHGAFSHEKLTDPNSVMEEPVLSAYRIGDSSEASRIVKETAKLFGAFTVGICELNPLWLYSRDVCGNPVSIPDDCRYAVVLTIRMDPTAIRTSPRWSASTETAVAYSRSAFAVSCLAEFIRNLGYKAIPAGNDTALSIPLAVDAGLGELGRNGLLITPELGPCVRLCKVFTNLPLEADEPRSFGVTDFCKRCRRCAKACEARAISDDAEPSFKTASPSNNDGILRWAVNHDACYGFWRENGADCSNCIAACPLIDGPPPTNEDRKI